MHYHNPPGRPCTDPVVPPRSPTLITGISFSESSGGRRAGTLQGHSSVRRRLVFVREGLWFRRPWNWGVKVGGLYTFYL